MTVQPLAQSTLLNEKPSQTARTVTPHIGRAEKAGPGFGHAVVIGGSIAGLTAARVLSDYFDQVTIVDRDQASDAVTFRRGVPQTRHAHRLLPRGQRILERYFPGLVDEMLSDGAVAVDPDEDISFDYEGGWRRAPWPGDWVSLSASRPLLESTIARRLAHLRGVSFLRGYEATGLLVEDRQVAGVRLAGRGDRRGGLELEADLVVDASGRHSKAPQWLEALGYTPPEEETVNSFGGYATRIYERPQNFKDQWKTMYVKPTPPHGTRGGIIVPLEGNRWQVTLLGVAGDYPPQDDDGFLSFARSLPTARLYEAIKASTPLSGPAGFRGTASRVRRYDDLPRYLEGFLVLGDAAFILNPVYAQGMTAAAQASEVLDRCLARQPEGDLTGLARAFQQRLTQSLNRLWQRITAEDEYWSATTTGNGDPLYLN